ncbi:hypothetical protein BDR26DRAFT_334482 [Obelidium mucronatum]|nr:hypothetical protein BDR26DRAFT_334482 [Obelidium mucronatum]
MSVNVMWISSTQPPTKQSESDKYQVPTAAQGSAISLPPLRNAQTQSQRIWSPTTCARLIGQFTLMNMEQVNCKNCILRWGWSATHISTTNPELYQNCVDIVLTKSNGGGGGGILTAPAPQPQPQPQPTKPQAPKQANKKKQKKAGKHPNQPGQAPAKPQVGNNNAPKIGGPCQAGTYVCGPHDVAVNQDTLLVCAGGAYALQDHCDHGQFVCKVIGGMPYCI